MKNPELQKIIDEIRSEVCEIMARDLLNFRPWLEPKDIPNPEKWTIKPKINCIHPEHNPPSHLYVESGHYYFHVCPSCKMQFLISGPPISL